MLSPSDFNNAVPQFTNGNYASNPINPQYIAEPDAESYNRGTEPLQTLPAQWWNWFLNRFTNRFNKVNIYVKNIFNELTQLLSLVSETPSGTESTPTVGQLKDMFENKYPNYLALLMYPVGSIYWTGKAPDDGGDPNVLFGGTWVQIKGKFVWAKGDSDTLNATGGAKTVTLTKSQIPSHNHSFTPAGSVSVTTNPTFTGKEHSYTYTPAGSISVTTNPIFKGTAVTSGGASTETVIIVDPGHSHGLTLYGNTDNATGGNEWTLKTAGGNKFVPNSNIESSKTGITAYHAHTHSVTANGSISGGIYKFTGTQATLKATANGSISGGAYKFTGTQATLKATAGGSISGGAYKFTGTAGVTGDIGDGNAHENMPPYVVKYCWERTA